MSMMQATKLSTWGIFTHRRTSFAGVLAMLVLAFAGAIFAGLAPEPDPIPTKWQLEFEPGPLRVAELTDNNGVTRPYFYMTYRVTNYSGQDLMFAPSFELVNKAGDIRRSGRDVRPEITAELMSRLRNPLLEDQISVLGQILQGVENAKDGLAVWPADDLETDSIQVFVAGLSGENKPFIVRDPETKRNRRVMLRKTLMLTYDTPGSLAHRGSTPLDLAETLWVMR